MSKTQSKSKKKTLESLALTVSEPPVAPPPTRSELIQILAEREHARLEEKSRETEQAQENAGEALQAYIRENAVQLLQDYVLLGKVVDAGYSSGTGKDNESISLELSLKDFVQHKPELRKLIKTFAEAKANHEPSWRIPPVDKLKAAIRKRMANPRREAMLADPDMVKQLDRLLDKLSITT